MHAHEPTVPGLATAALRHTRGLIVATFHAETERALSYPIRSGRRKRYGSRIDALLAASTRAAELAEQLYPGDYQVHARPHLRIFQPAARRPRVAAEWTSEGRGVAAGLIRTVADAPGVELTLAWDRRGRRPMRPHVPPRARGRVRTSGLERRRTARARLLGPPIVFVAAPDGNALLAWEARASRRRRGLGRRGPGLRYAADQPPLAAAAVARLLEQAEPREQLGEARSPRPQTQRGAATLAERLECALPRPAAAAPQHGPQTPPHGRR